MSSLDERKINKNFSNSGINRCLIIVIVRLMISLLYVKDMCFPYEKLFAILQETGKPILLLVFIPCFGAGFSRVHKH